MLHALNGFGETPSARTLDSSVRTADLPVRRQVGKRGLAGPKCSKIKRARETTSSPTRQSSQSPINRPSAQKSIASSSVQTPIASAKTPARPSAQTSIARSPAKSKIAGPSAESKIASPSVKSKIASPPAKLPPAKSPPACPPVKRSNRNNDDGPAKKRKKDVSFRRSPVQLRKRK